MDLITKQRAVGKNPNKSGACPVNKGRIACVDLTHQLSWIQDGKKLVYGRCPCAPAARGTSPAPA